MPHTYDQIFADYVRTPPSLSAYPKADMVETALADGGEAHARRPRGVAPGRRPRVRDRQSADEAIDERIIRYLDRSDAFDDAKVESKSADGTTLVLSAAVKRNISCSAPTPTAATCCRAC